MKNGNINLKFKKESKAYDIKPPHNVAKNLIGMSAKSSSKDRNSNIKFKKELEA